VKVNMRTKKVVTVLATKRRQQCRKRPCDKEATDYLTTHADFQHFPYTLRNSGPQDLTAQLICVIDSSMLYCTCELFEEILNEKDRFAGERIQNVSLLTTYYIMHSYWGVQMLETERKDCFSNSWFDKTPFFFQRYVQLVLIF
jgi:hypothetical protein